MIMSIPSASPSLDILRVAILDSVLVEEYYLESKSVNVLFIHKPLALSVSTTND